MCEACSVHGVLLPEYLGIAISLIKKNMAYRKALKTIGPNSDRCGSLY